jgi:hypothetical protein
MLQQHCAQKHVLVWTPALGVHQTFGIGFTFTGYGMNTNIVKINDNYYDN